MKIVDSIKISRILLFTTLIFLLFLAYLSYMRLQNLIEYGKLVDDSARLNFKLEQCLSFLKDVETGQLGYLLTRDTLFLEPMHDAQKKIYQALDQLTVIAKTDRENLPAILEFKRNALKRISYLNKIVHDDREGKIYTGLGMSNLLHGKMLMDETRGSVDKIQASIEHKLHKRQQIKDRYEVLTPFFMIVLSLVSIFFIYIAYRIIVRELKKRTSVQAALEYNIQALKQSNEELEQFAYVASHDLQEPLRKIQTFGNRLLLKHKENLDDDGQFIINRMHKAAERMQVLINDLLSYSQIANAATKKFEWVDLNRVLTNVLDILSVEIQNKKAQVKNERLPALSGNMRQMEQLFQNILSNALKFVSNDRFPLIEIEYGIVSGKEISGIKYADIEKLFHKITFIDNGIGFEPQYAEKIFVIFQRLQNKSQYKGTGIGLAMCKKIVAYHDGYITAKSTIDKGSQFIVYLPKDFEISNSFN